MSKNKRVELPKNMKCAFYCRVAREDDDAIAMQKSVLQEYAEKQGYTNISVYADNGASGMNFNRPALLRLEADIQAGLVDAVIIRSFDRIGRDFLKTEEWLSGIRQKGVSFLSIADGASDSSFDGTEILTSKFQEAYMKHLAVHLKKRRTMRRSG
jgi:DNA invertase Pin-like site-specific DNA recombinase